MEITIPVNTKARILVPNSDHDSITESGIPAHENKDLTYVSSDEKGSYFDVKSGHYIFLAPYKKN